MENNIPKTSIVMSTIKKNTTTIISVAITILIIYLSPLKNLNLIEPHIRDIDPKVLYEKMQKDPNHFVFIDVRPDDMYKAEHAKGAENIILHKLYYERVNLPKHGKEIALICQDGVASGVAYSYLEHYGFMNIYRVAGGIKKWNDEKLPTEKATSTEKESGM